MTEETKSLFDARSLREQIKAYERDGDYISLAAMADLAVAEIEMLRGVIHGAVSFTYIDTEQARLQSRENMKRAMGWPMSPDEAQRLALLRAKALEAITLPDQTPEDDIDVTGDDGFGI